MGKQVPRLDWGSSQQHSPREVQLLLEAATGPVQVPMVMTEPSPGHGRVETRTHKQMLGSGHLPCSV